MRRNRKPKVCLYAYLGYGYDNLQWLPFARKAHPLTFVSFR